MASFNSSFLREIVDEIDSHYSEAEGLQEATTTSSSSSSSSSSSGNSSSSNNRRGSLPIQIEYVFKASTAVALQALDAGQAHMTDINMVLSQNPFNGLTGSSRYSRSEQVITQSTVVIVRGDANIASLHALRGAIFLSEDQESRTVVVDSQWNHQSLARVLPPYTIYELLSEGVPGSQLIDVLLDEEALAATTQMPLPWVHYGLRQFVAGATYATGAFFLMDRHGSKCPTAASAKAAAAAAAAAAPPRSEHISGDKPGEDPALSSLRRELTKKSVTFQRPHLLSGRPKPVWDSGSFPGEGPLGAPLVGEDSYPATPGPWTTEPSTPVGETDLFDSLKMNSLEPLASGRRYIRTRSLQEAYNAALVQLVNTSVLDGLIEDLQEINIVPFFDCGGTVPGSVSGSFPLPHRIPADDALMDILRTGVVLVGMPIEMRAAAVSPEVLYAQRATVEVVAAIGAEYHTTLQARFVPFPTAQHVLRALHKGLIHLADARVLFEYASPHARLGFRVRPTCALGAARLWMVSQNKEGMTSLEELHETLDKLPDSSDKRVGVVEQHLQNTVCSVLPSGVAVLVLGVEEAAEALLSRAVAAVFGMATQQRRLLRSLLHLEKKMAEREERPWEKTTPDNSTASNSSSGGGSSNSSTNTSSSSSSSSQEAKQDAPKAATPYGSPGSRSPVGGSPEASNNSSSSSSRPSSERYDNLSEDGSGGFSWPMLAPSLQYTKDIFQELMKAEGLPLETPEAPQQSAASWIDVDTGVTAVVHSFFAASLRPPRSSQQ
ncbi:hypothetical protein, conserved [Eimeria acervulina]|uniref:Uncharacterized protein n=1 Tax=Eimeria acervulina TaxID=5801 RepID=U6GFL1_EIMAC|nr:hypothetical protein, conserved [Eimeria acervulina]CDI78063.1 hypothetical protein, conserved [Eimeria acervulina]